MSLARNRDLNHSFFQKHSFSNITITLEKYQYLEIGRKFKKIELGLDSNYNSKDQLMINDSREENLINKTKKQHQNTIFSENVNNYLKPKGLEQMIFDEDNPKIHINEYSIFNFVTVLKTITLINKITTHCSKKKVLTSSKIL